MIELLTSLGVIALLLAVLLPVIQDARERARSVSCVNKLRQIGVACHLVSNTFGSFPPVSGNVTRPMAVNSGDPFYQKSAHYDLLPELDHANLQSKLNLAGDRKTQEDPPQSTRNQSTVDMPLPIFQCPSDPLSQRGVSYLICNGTSTLGEKITGPQPANSVLPGVATGPRIAEIKDGLSNTIAFSERLIGDQRPERYTPARDWAWVPHLSNLLNAGPVLPDTTMNVCQNYVGADQKHASFNSIGWLFGDLGTTTYNHILTPNSQIPDCAAKGGGIGAYSARSLHTGGVNVLFADGTVKFFSEEVHPSTWRALGSIHGSETID